FDGLRGSFGAPALLDDAGPMNTVARELPPKCPIDDVIRSFLVRSEVSNVYHATSDKISRLRQFFGSERINALDPRPPDVLKRRRKKIKMASPWFKEDDLALITTDTILKFLAEKNYSRSYKRHYRELFHELFQHALKSGAYRPENPYAANPADDLPSFKGTGEPITVLSVLEVAEQYRAVSPNALILFGCQLMLEGGFRMHEILTLKRRDLDVGGKIRLILPDDGRSNSTRLKTGQRSVTVRPVLRPMIERFRETIPGGDSDWCFASPTGDRMTSDTFGELLRQLNRAAGHSWTTQDFRHTFATNRIEEGWNLKTLAQEMGTSVQMLMEHYAGFIEPPVLAAARSI
ncbi:MAG: tyrosine-type recombinase/integrase, partial [Verrucomicrobiae bacterium]|nr:tyrosine-type recombinase/integrase [Verrucomicrobiae bacterium]